MNGDGVYIFSSGEDSTFFLKLMIFFTDQNKLIYLFLIIGAQYEGSFKDNLFNGTGLYTFPDGNSNLMTRYPRTNFPPP